MRNTEPGWYQVVFDPEEENLNEMMAAAKAATDSGDIHMTTWLSIKFGLGQLFHPLVHHYVPMKRWDVGSQRAISMPYETCLWCPRIREI